MLSPYSLVEEKIAAGVFLELPVKFDKRLPPTGIIRREGSKPSESSSLLMAEFQKLSEQRGREGS